MQLERGSAKTRKYEEVAVEAKVKPSGNIL